ncbi:MAG: hypothetical protein ACRC30_05095 [Clostridium sp.]
MNLYKLKNIEEDLIIKIELSDRVKKNIRKSSQIINFEIHLIEKLRKGYSYGVLNRYILSNEELINWLNDAKLGGTILVANNKEIENAEKILEVNLILQGDKEFFKGDNNNFYNELENITPFGVESLNKVIFQRKNYFIRDIVVVISIIVAAIDIFKLRSISLGIIVVAISGGVIGYIKLRDRKRIEKFIKFNQRRIDYSKKIYENKTGKKGKDLKYVTEKRKCYVIERD